MSPLNTPTDRTIRELVLANHILALEGVLDAYGHVSARHPYNPTRYFLSRSRSPEIVSEDDILEHDQNGEVSGVPEHDLYRERFIHAALYKARPEVNAVIHSHAEDVLPFSVTGVPLRAVFHGASSIGSEPVPVWDIRDDFGPTNLLVTKIEQADSLARTLRQRRVVLMRGHGFVAAAETLIAAVRMAVTLPKNARVMMDAIRLGGPITSLSAEECALRDRADVSSPAVQRAWEHWCRRLGVPYEPGGY